MKYRIFGTSGLRVSELCLGAMTFGVEWGWGADKHESKRIFDAFAKAGGNFLDTANRYTEGTSERWLGEFIKNDRDHFVLATKFTLKDRHGDLNFAGSHRKNMMRSVNESLRRLDTEFIDLLWVHAWDHLTPTDEVMRGLEDLVSSGKVHYIGVSDTPAWVVSHAQTLAQMRGWAAFAGLQIEYSLLQRTPERDLLPMAKHFGLAVTPWGPIGGGALTGKYLRGDKGRLNDNSARLNERAQAIAAKVVEVAEKMGVQPAHIAINWTRQRDPQLTTIPIVGARTEAQITDTLSCADQRIPDELIRELDEISAIELGFPHDFLQSDGVRDVVFSGMLGQIF
ncbi:MAG: aldo/keto reductase [Saprospiraceae bacterium]